MTKITAILCAAAAAAAILPIATSSDAEAGKRSGGYYYYEEFNTKRPERGFQGFVGAGKYGAYCSYRREPKRRCIYSHSGRERCKIVGWKLIQHCY